ncbi:MAG: hypothetical protein IJ811_04160, partial [Clostridia bacterium]|nr:hypothetical protein [Clostridia bacterium]
TNYQPNTESAESGSITILDLWYILKKYFWRILLLTAIVVAIEAGVTFKLIKPDYTSTAIIVVDATNAFSTNTSAGTLTSERNAYVYGQELIPSIVKFIKSSDELKQDVAKAAKVAAAKRAEQPEAVTKGDYIESLIGAVNVTNTTDEYQITVTYTTKTGPQYARDTLEQLIKSVIDISEDTATTADGKEKTVYPWHGTISFQNHASNGRESNRWGMFVIITFAAAFVLFYAYYVIATLLDDTIKSKKEIEMLTGYNVMAYIEDIDLEKLSKRKRRSYGDPIGDKKSSKGGRENG